MMQTKAVLKPSAIGVDVESVGGLFFLRCAILIERACGKILPPNAA